MQKIVLALVLIALVELIGIAVFFACTPSFKTPSASEPQTTSVFSATASGLPHK
ncbi:MAG TPA: hypothetical protein VLA05_04790 [Coriobacteriia bacterium]|nr:hypothetical protein [Coriobacteriia bacterium]